jgi:D-alanine-D-alanine ligase
MTEPVKTEKIRVGVLFGGTSSEKEVSLATGRYVLNLMDPSRFIPVAVYMDYHGRLWKLPPKLVLSNTSIDVENRLEEHAQRIRYEELPELIDFAFIALLGKVGEDGTIQGLLELLKVPYSGSGIQASAVAMHKRANKDLLKANGILVAEDIRVLKSDYKTTLSIEALGTQIESSLKFPVIVKPVAEGSSVGVSAVHNVSELGTALDEAFRWDKEVLIEEFIKGQEFMCVVFGNDEPNAMLPSEVEFVGDIFTYESKYMPGKAEYHTPIRAPKEKVEEIQQIAIQVYKMMGIKGYGRVDGFLVDKDKIYISEPHTGTIMVPSSYVFQQASLQDIPTKGKAGMKGKSGSRFNPRMFISAIVELGMEAHANKIGIL